MRKPIRGNPDRTAAAVSANVINSLIAELRSTDMRMRVKARQSLAQVGEPAIPALVRALDNRNQWTRLEASKALEEMNLPWARHASVRTIRALVHDLGSKDGVVRVVARRSLVHIGERAVTGLVQALRGKNSRARWEAAKALGQIGDARSTAALVEALDDNLFDVRWVAAEALVRIGDDAAPPILHALTHQPDSLWLREGAHHVFHELKKRHAEDPLVPVLKALQGGEPSIEVPFAAEKALEQLGAGQDFHKQTSP
jgi:HEAT repeat protein